MGSTPAATATATGKEENTAATATSANPTATDNTSTDATNAATDSATTNAPTTTESVASLPGLSSTTNTAYDGITNAPTVTGGIPNYPAPSVPPTYQAPFMQKSSAPNGTVFIAVGAILGFLLLVFLAWRGMVAWSLRRSLERANHQPINYDSVRSEARASMLQNAAPFYSNGPGSQMSLDHFSAGRRVASREAAGSLFFSPTAAVGVNQGDRRTSSAYLPAGYYAAGASNPSLGRPISMADFTRGAPQIQGYQRAQSVVLSPPVSPLIPPAPGMESFYDGDHGRVVSTASLNVAPTARTPSAYLDDLFDNPPEVDDTRSGVSRY